MATSLEMLKDELKDITRFQQTPIPYLDSDYRRLIKRGLERFYADYRIGNRFNQDYYEEEIDGEIIGNLNRNLSLEERQYVLIAAEIAFKHQIRADVATLVSYTTNAMSVAGADKPYRNLKEEIEELEQRLLDLYY